MQYFGYSVNIIFVIVALLLFQRIFLFHVQFVNGMNTSYVQIRNELASEQLIKVQFQVAMSGRYSRNWPHFAVNHPFNIAAELNFFQNQNINSPCLEAEGEMKVLGF